MLPNSILLSIYKRKYIHENFEGVEGKKLTLHDFSLFSIQSQVYSRKFLFLSFTRAFSCLSRNSVNALAKTLKTKTNTCLNKSSFTTGQINPKSRLASRRFSQETNGQNWFVRREANKTNSSVPFLGEPICFPNKLTFILSVFCLFFGRIWDFIICLRDLLTFSRGNFLIQYD